MMYKKIQHPDEEVIITKGTILIEFPVDGSSAETIDLSRPELFRLYEVEKKEKGVIIASCADQSAEDILQKPVTQLVRESRWWMDNEM